MANKRDRPKNKSQTKGHFKAGANFWISFSVLLFFPLPSLFLDEFSFISTLCYRSQKHHVKSHLGLVSLVNCRRFSMPKDFSMWQAPPNLEMFELHGCESDSSMRMICIELNFEFLFYTSVHGWHFHLWNVTLVSNANLPFPVKRKIEQTLQL